MKKNLQTRREYIGNSQQKQKQMIEKQDEQLTELAKKRARPANPVNTVAKGIIIDEDPDSKRASPDDTLCSHASVALFLPRAHHGPECN